MTDLNGIRVVVTGATSGLGAVMAAALAAAGARVMAADLGGSSVTVNILLPGGQGTRTGMVPWSHLPGLPGLVV